MESAIFDIKFEIIKIYLIKKILKVDYPRGRAKKYYANLISAMKPKIEFSLFHPTVPSA